MDEPFSEKAEEKRQAKRKGKRGKRKKPTRRGRLSTAEKIAKAARTETVYPDDCDPQDCQLSHTRVAWRLEDGRAVLVAYDIYRQGNRYGQPPGVPGRGEFGMEILIALAYQVYTLGLSLDKACQVLGFFQNLSLKKSQANALLNQLARVWEQEFDTLCTIYRTAKRVANDKRYGPAGRERRVTELEAELLALCGVHSVEGSQTEGVEDDYRRLVNEVMRLLLVKELFVFVTTEGVVGNNNVSERELRDDAQRRNTGRTNKTPTGAKRQSILASVLRTLGKQLSKFTLASVLAEIQRWAERGRSCFTDQAKAAGLNRAPPDAEQPSLLDRIILDVDNPELAAA